MHIFKFHSLLPYFKIRNLPCLFLFFTILVIYSFSESHRNGFCSAEDKHKELMYTYIIVINIILFVNIIHMRINNSVTGKKLILTVSIFSNEF